MEVYLMQHGIYPRPRGLAKAISRYISGKLSREDLDKIYARYTEKFFKYMLNLGYNRFSDGMLRWDDIFNPMISGIEGVEINGLRRFYDNNYFFRQPIIKNKINYREAIASILLEKSIEIAKKMGITSDRVALSLPGPFTMATNSLLDQNIYSIEELMRDYVEKVIFLEVEKSLKIGVKNIDLHEPSLVVYEAPLNYIENIYRELSERFPNSRFWIIMYFGYKWEVLQTFARLASKNGNIFCTVDVTEVSPPPWDQIIDLVSMGDLALAVVNARTTKMENYKDLVYRILEIARRRDSGELYITHNTSLEFLPEVVAMKKLRLLRRIAKSVREKLYSRLPHSKE
jgi:5-methyltetrahydropteroyltriglutamate--homocysteine methyltransferase